MLPTMIQMGRRVFMASGDLNVICKGGWGHVNSTTVPGPWQAAWGRAGGQETAGGELRPFPRKTLAGVGGTQPAERPQSPTQRGGLPDLSDQAIPPFETRSAFAFGPLLFLLHGHCFCF